MTDAAVVSYQNSFEEASQTIEDDTKNARSALNNLKLLLADDLEAADCEVILCTKQGRRVEDRYRTLRMSGDLADSFKSEFSISLKELLADALEDSEGLRPYAFGDGVEGTVSYLRSNAYQSVASRIAEIPGQHKCENFNPNDDFINRLKCIYVVITLGCSNERLIIGQTRGPSRVLNRSSLMAMLINLEYDRVEAKDTLMFSSNIDFLVWRDLVFVNRLETFEAFFSIREATKAMALNAVTTMLTELPVEIEIAPDVLSRVRISKKLSKLGCADHLKLLTTDKIREQIARHDLPVQVVEMEEGKWKLVLDRPHDHNDQMLLLRLLDDDLYSSLLTDNRYAARAKDRR